MSQACLEQLLADIRPADKRAMEAARRHWDSLAKPLGGLGAVEDAIVRIAGMTGDPHVELTRRAVVAMCADNGVVAEGVTQTGQEVTAVVTENMSRGASSVCLMSKCAGADVFPVDIGVARPVTGERILQRNVRRSTANMVHGPAMTPQEARQALLVGVEIAQDLSRQGYQLLATGEMGIGNTTTSSAMVSVLLDVPPERVTGRGAGLSSEGLARKVNAVKTAIAVNRPDPSDPLDTVSKVGGLDIAGLMGVYLGGAALHMPVLIDGLISSVAALAAARLCPAAADYMLASHASGEPAGELVLDALGLRPFLRAGMHLGEGTGAVAVLPLLDMGLAVYHGMPTFEGTKIEAYQPLT